MRRQSVFLTLASLLIFLPSGRAVSAPPDMPAAGAVVKIDGDPFKIGLNTAFLTDGPKVGDPDSSKFDESCRLALPLEVRVLGSFEGTIVARYGSGAKQPDTIGCPSGGVVLFSLPAWQALKKVEAAAAAARAEKERRKEKVRQIIRQPAAG